jgi:tetratricopeptide (TPR) repeat protein
MAWGDEDLLEATIADRSEYSQELRVSQVAPRFRVPGAAYLTIRAEDAAAVEARVAGLPDSLKTMLHVVDAEDLHRRWGEWYVGLPARGKLLYIGHETERTYGGYGNLLRTLKELAPSLGDARWFITPREEPEWIDELRVVDGVLGYERVEVEEDVDEAALRGEALREDAELRAFLAWRIVRELERPGREGLSEQDAQVAARRMALAQASALDPDGHEVLFQQGTLARACGDHEAALGWFIRASWMDDPMLVGRLTTMAATAIAAGDRQKARDWLDRAVTGRPSMVTWMLRGYLNKDGDGAAEDAARAIGAPPADREVLPWTLLDWEILEWFAGCEPPGVTAVARARAILGWAELYRIRTCHELRTEKSRALADRLFTLAEAVDPLGGEIAYYRVVHAHGHQTPAALAGFEAVLARFPEEPNALFWAASGLCKIRAWGRANELLRRYERVVGTGRSYERGAARSMLVETVYREACERMYERGDFGGGTEGMIEEAIALTGKEARWEGPWIAKGDLFEYRREHPAALKCYETAIAKNPRSVHAWSGKGSCLNNLGRSAEALASLDKALALSKDYWHAYYAKACTLARSGGDAEEILMLVRKAITLEPTRRRQIVEDPDLAGLTIPPEWK